MAVYTKLNKEDVEKFLARYNVGALVKFSPIEEGIQNTNYFVQTSQAKFILTIYEGYVNADDLPFFIALTDHLRQHGINCPHTLKDKNGTQIQDLKGKKASLISFLEGQGVKKIEDYHLSELGKTIAHMHLAVGNFTHQRKNDFSISRWTKILEQIGDRADEISQGLTKLIADEIYFLAANWPFALPGGVIHADVFPDNVFFIDKQISGLIDFYFACTDAFAYDIAIIFNAWNIHNNENRQNIFLKSYEAIRPLTAEEKNAMPVLMRGAALRFLMTRLYDWFNTPNDAHVKRKDPVEYLEKLKTAQFKS